MGKSGFGQIWARRTRRLVMAVLGAGLAMVPTSCFPQPAASPIITASSFSPSSVVAGSAFSLSVNAASPSGRISAMVLVSVRTPSGGALPWGPGCPQGNGGSGPLGPERSATWTCTIPADAPSGAWHAQVRVFDEGYGITEADFPFEVTGGSSDTEGPEVSVSIPDTVARGTSFDVTVLATDEHGPAAFSGEPTITLMLDPALGVDRIQCAPGAWTEIDAATWEFAATCTVGVGQPVGEYGVPGWTFFDRFGQITSVSIATTVV